MRALPLLLLLVLCFAAQPARADTGTYVIEEYDITLTPHADGVTDTDCHQRWRVTGGHIPWITVGLPNENFAITGSGLAVKEIAPQNEGGWSGVRLDLDRDYQPGQSFDISFSVKQRKLFYADNENYRLDYWPGWYDNAPTESLTIRVKTFAKPESIAADPAPTAKTEAMLEWSGVRLSEGERYPIHLSFPKTALPQGIPAGELRSEGGEPEERPSGEGDNSGGAGFFVFIIFLFVFFTIVFPFLRWLLWVARGRHGRYTGGGIFFGGSGPSGGGPGRAGRHTGGGGGFGGGGFSCACACVSCACACACAGGGGAGCSRKVRHTCPLCDRVERGAQHA